LNFLEIKNQDFPFLIVDDLFSELDINTMVDEAVSLKDNFHQGNQFGVVDFSRKKNLNLHLNEFFPDFQKSLIITTFRKRFWSDVMRAYFKNSSDHFLRSILFTNWDNTLLSAYGDGDSYPKHRDDCVLTANLFLAKTPVEFKGGDFIIHEGEGHIVDFVPGRLVIFPSYYEHSVEPISGENLTFDKYRFSLQYWANPGRG